MQRKWTWRRLAMFMHTWTCGKTYWWVLLWYIIFIVFEREEILECCMVTNGGWRRSSQYLSPLSALTVLFSPFPFPSSIHHMHPQPFLSGEKHSERLIYTMVQVTKCIKTLKGKEFLYLSKTFFFLMPERSYLIPSGYWQNLHFAQEHSTATRAELRILCVWGGWISFFGKLEQVTPLALE